MAVSFALLGRVMELFVKYALPVIPNEKNHLRLKKVSFLL
jgi:hypothetical protein